VDFCPGDNRNDVDFSRWLLTANGEDHVDFCPGDNRNDERALLFLDKVPLSKIYSQISTKTKQLQDLAVRGDQGQWMYYDSGASRTVIQTEPPLRPLLTQVQATSGACTVGSGVKLPYVESGILFEHNPVTVVDGLHFDLYSAVASAKQKGTSAVIDFDMETGENKSFTFCKHTGEASPLVERKPGVLEIPMHLPKMALGATSLILSDWSTLSPQHP
jgi:hypothetical protein